MLTQYGVTGLCGVPSSWGGFRGGAENLRRGCLVEAGGPAVVLDHLQECGYQESVCLECAVRVVPRHRDERHGREVIDLVGAEEAGSPHDVVFPDKFGIFEDDLFGDVFQILKCLRLF